MSEKATLNFNNKPYIIEDLPPGVQDLLKIHQTWNEELQDAKLNVFKIEAALRGLMSELEIRINKFDQEQANQSTPTA